MHFLWRSLAAAYGRFEAAAQLAVSYASSAGTGACNPSNCTSETDRH